MYEFDTSTDVDHEKKSRHGVARKPLYRVCRLLFSIILIFATWGTPMTYLGAVEFGFLNQDAEVFFVVLLFLFPVIGITLLYHEVWPFEKTFLKYFIWGLAMIHLLNFAFFFHKIVLQDCLKFFLNVLVNCLA